MCRRAHALAAHLVCGCFLRKKFLVKKFHRIYSFRVSKLLNKMAVCTKNSGGDNREHQQEREPE